MKLPKFPVTPAKVRNLIVRMEALDIDEADLEETFFCPRLKGSRAGAQTGVSIFHAATGTRARTRQSRRQIMNRFFARRLLVEELERVAGVAGESAREEVTHTVEEAGDNLILTREPTMKKVEDVLETKISHMHRMFVRQANTFLDPMAGRK